jgi:hypothetical protein
VTAQLKSWFLRDVLEALERERVGSLLRVRERAPERLHEHLALDEVRAKGSLETLPLDEAEELVLLADSVLGDGTGRVIENVGAELIARALFQDPTPIVVGDMIATLHKLRALIERPFVRCDVIFELQRAELGFILTTGVVGRPRATKVLRHLTCGAIRVAQRHAHEPDTAQLRLTGDTLGDRATILVMYRQQVTPEYEPDLAQTHTRKSRAPSTRPPRLSTLSAEVERIFAGKLPAEGEPRSVRSAPAENPRSVRPVRRTSSAALAAVPEPAPDPEIAPDDTDAQTRRSGGTG